MVPVLANDPGLEIDHGILQHVVRKADVHKKTTARRRRLQCWRRRWRRRWRLAPGLPPPAAACRRLPPSAAAYRRLSPPVAARRRLLPPAEQRHLRSSNGTIRERVASYL